ncbi:hypothetical protein [Lacticaseibacillus kribbianus]|uniref:hypothetical protein n=1 Tax=Lacticaseibacillus kribbianus TaxID=2926292 RepID=UPI001CD1DF2A|nr:hypothetical protein [Lacticaseibacillus kribbianus]
MKKNRSRTQGLDELERSNQRRIHSLSKRNSADTAITAPRVAFTDRQRTAILFEMSKSQRDTYEEHLQLSVSDRVMNLVFSEAPEWRFIGVRVDLGWQFRKSDPELLENLRCVCGRQLRYQYNLVGATDSGRHMNLGSSHFMQHLEIPEAVAREVFEEFNQVQHDMDDMVLQYSLGEKFPTNYGMKDFALSSEFAQEQSIAARRIHDFAAVDLPLTRGDVLRLKGFMRNR